MLGVSSARSDVEVIALAWDLLEALGVQGLELQINSLGTPDDRRRYREQLVVWLQERADQLDSDSQERLITNPLRILDSKNTSTQALLVDAPTLLEALSEESSARFTEVQTLLSQLAIPFRVNTRLVRGLDYYGHAAFEITSAQLGARPPSVVVVVTTGSSNSWVVRRPPRSVGLWGWSACCCCWRLLLGPIPMEPQPGSCQLPYLW